MNDNRKIHYTSLGEEVVFRPAGSARWAQTIIQSSWVIGVALLIRWSGPAILAYFRDGEITGAARHLERFDLSDTGMQAAMLGWCLFLIWWGIGGMYEVVKINLRRDKFTLRSDGIHVERRKILTRKHTLPAYQPVVLQLSPHAGTLEAKTKNGGTILLTDLGTVEDRQWLLALLQQRYHASSQLPVVETTRETVGTYIVERRPDNSILIVSSGLSTVGCGVLAAFACSALLAVAVWVFASGSPAGFIPIMFACAIAFAGLSALNRRSVVASRGRLVVNWSSPVGKLLKKFEIGQKNRSVKMHFGEGQAQYDRGMLSINKVQRNNSSPMYSIILLYEENDPNAIQVEEIDGSNDDLSVEKAVVLQVHGSGSEHMAAHFIRVLSDATGFPVGTTGKTEKFDSENRRGL